MKNLLVVLAVAAAAGYFGYQKYSSNDLYGEWQLDVNAMTRQLKDSNVPQTSIDEFVRQMGNGRTTTIIGKEKMTVSINGDKATFAYETLGRNGGCTTIKAETKTLDYCVKGDVLEVRNRKNSLFEVYKRI